MSRTFSHMFYPDGMVNNYASSPARHGECIKQTITTIHFVHPEDHAFDMR